jgi:hypothetical protein
MTMPPHRRNRAKAVAKTVSARDVRDHKARLILFGAGAMLSFLLLLDLLLGAGRLTGP